MGCAATDVVEFTHDATTALSANDKVTISGVQNPLSILATAALTGTKPAITGHATGGESTNVGTTGGTGSGLVVTVVTADGTPPTLTSVTVTTAGTGYKPGDVITVTGAGSSTAGDFNSFSMTLQPGDFDGTSIASSTYAANVGPNMLKTGKNRQFLKITNIECADTDVLEFTHDATTALSANDKVTISGVQISTEGKTAVFYNAEHTVTGTPTTTKFRAAGASCSGSGTAINYEVYGDVTALAANAGSEVQTAVPVNGINYGDTIRVGDEFRRVVDDTGRHYATGAPGKIFRLSSGFAVPATRDTVLGFATAVPAPIFKQNGMMYDIRSSLGAAPMLTAATTELTRTPLTDRIPLHSLRVTTWVPSATLEAPAFAQATHTLEMAARLTGAALTRHRRNTCLETSTTWNATSLILRLRFRCAQPLLCRAPIRARWF